MRFQRTFFGMQAPDQYLLDLPELQERDRPTFENFVPGRNVPVLAALCEMAAGSGPRLLYIYGAVGAGLSHLIAAFLSDGLSDEALRQLPLNVQGAARSGGAKVPRFEAQQLRYAVDDVETLQGEEVDALRRLIDAVRASDNARLVCAGHASPNALPLPPDIKSRLLQGLSARVAPLDEHERFRELRRLAALRGIVMSEEMENWMSTRLSRDMRTLTRVLDIANQLSLHAKSRVTLATVKAAARIAREAGLLDANAPNASALRESVPLSEAPLSAHHESGGTVGEQSARGMTQSHVARLIQEIRDRTGKEK